MSVRFSTWWTRDTRSRWGYCGMRWVGFVRNVMLGREGLHRQVLIDLVEAAGGTNVRSHLTTGNVTFDAPRTRADAVVRRTEAAIAAVVGRHEPVILREIVWLQDVVGGDPFRGYLGGAWELEVGFLPLGVAPIDPGRLPDLERTVLLQLGEREAFTARPREGGRRPHVVSLLQEATGSRATSRGWSSLEKIAAHGA